MTALYDDYLAQGGPALPEGYSFKVEHRLGGVDMGEDRFFFSILGPPKGLLKRRHKEWIDGGYLPYDYGHTWLAEVTEEDRRLGDPPIEAWFIWNFQFLYGLWRASTYNKDIRANWDAFIGVHP